ncbi:MAG: exodeoxyribonuclease III [Alphaproteobacteria bacterium]|nr:exodeoxyribonuclease III [Alphaproteobacteria bacterium]
MKIATWNVNSIRTRLPHLQAWLTASKPDVALLQELKCTAEEFPIAALQGAGYEATVLGQKTWNGVAILTRQDAPKPQLTADHLNLPDNPLDARYIEGQVGDWRFASVYVPNGQSLDSEKFSYKLRFLKALEERLCTLMASELPVVVGGDFNIAPAADDVYAPSRFGDDVLYALPVRQAWRRLINQGWIDGLRLQHPHQQLFTWWDYRGNAWPAGHGCRIDHLLLSPTAANRLRAAGVDSDQRALEQPSDHAPVWVELA